MKPNEIFILIACEESQRVCAAFRERGFNAFSCDLYECSGGHPEWHIRGDALAVINAPVYFTTQDGKTHHVREWGLILAHPPCTYLTNTGNRWFDVSRYGNSAIERFKLRAEAAQFFMQFVNCNAKRVAIENPIGYMSTYYRKPTQIIHPYMFGDPERKATCLWIRGLPNIVPTDVVKPNVICYKNGSGTDSPWHMETMKMPPAERSRARSMTFPGMAKAIAQQWGDYLIELEGKS